MNAQLDLRTEKNHWQQSQVIIRRVRQALELRFPIVLPRSFSLERAKRVRGVVIGDRGRRES